MLRIVLFSAVLLLIAALFTPSQAQQAPPSVESSNALSTVSPPNLDAFWASRDIQPLRDWLAGVDEVRANQADALRIRARLAQLDGDLDQASALIEQALERVPDSPELKSRLLFEQAALKLNDLDDSGMFRSLRIARSAREGFEQAVELNPDYVAALFGLLQYHSNAPAIAGGRESRAAEARTRLEALAPAQLLFNDALELMATEQPQAALPMMDQALAMDSDYHGRPRWLLLKSVLLQQLDQFEAAAEVLEQALDQYPNHAGLWYQRGRTAAESGLELGRGLEAMLRYNELQHWPGDPEPAAAWWRIGQIQQALGRTDGAREAFEYALNLNPEFEEARQALDALVGTEAG